MSGGGSGGGGTTQTIQKADPWSGIQPYLSGMYQSANNTPAPSYYPGGTVAGLGPDIEQALSRGMGRSMYGNPAMNSAQGLAQGEMQGSWLNSNPSNGFYTDWANGKGPISPSGDYYKTLMNRSPDESTNPYLSGMVTSATRGLRDNWSNTVAPGIASMFGAAGRTGSGAMGAELMSKASPLMNSIQDVTSNLYGHAYDVDAGRRDSAAGMLNNIYSDFQNRRFAGAAGLSGDYQNERGLQHQSMAMSPQFAANDWNDISKMMGVGEYQRDFTQQNIDAAKAGWDYNQQALPQHLSWLNSILNGGLNFGTTTGSSNQQMRTPTNPFMSGVGGAMMGGALAGMSNGAIGGPMGMLLGGGLGLLGGGLFH